MRYSLLRHLLLLLFLLVLSNSAYAVILIPSYQTVTLDYYEPEPFELSVNATLNILPGGSAELYEYNRSTNANLNIFGGEVRNNLGGDMIVPEIFMSDGYIDGIFDVSTKCYANILGGTIGPYGLDGNCDITIIDGLIEGPSVASWNGEILIYGGTFQSKLGTLGGGFFKIHGGIFEVPELIAYHSISTIDFYGHGLTMTDPVLLQTSPYESQYNTQVTGHLSDGNFVDMNVTYIVNGEYGGVTLHNVPEPSALILFGAGLIGIGVSRLRRTK